MSETTQTADEIGDEDVLYRAITDPTWYVDAVLTTAAFGFRAYSVDVARLAGLPEATAARFRPGTGVAAVVCRDLREEKCTVRLEEEHGNPAHANVTYSDEVGSSQRKKAAKRLAMKATVVLLPTFDSPS